MSWDKNTDSGTEISLPDLGYSDFRFQVLLAGQLVDQATGTKTPTLNQMAMLTAVFMVTMVTASAASLADSLAMISVQQATIPAAAVANVSSCYLKQYFNQADNSTSRTLRQRLSSPSCYRALLQLR